MQIAPNASEAAVHGNRESAPVKADDADLKGYFERHIRSRLETAPPGKNEPWTLSALLTAVTSRRRESPAQRAIFQDVVDELARTGVIAVVKGKYNKLFVSFVAQ